MIKGCFKTATALLIASLLDKYLYEGRYAKAAFAMLQQIRVAFGV